MSITPFTQRQGWAPVRQRSTAATVAEIIGIGVGLWGLATMLNIVSSEGGVGATAFAGILAFIPLLVVLGAVAFELGVAHAGNAAHVANCGYVVAAAASGRGIATMMCEHSQIEARERGFLAMQFNFVVATNRRAVDLWKRLGFEIVGQLPKAFRHPEQGLVDAYVMYKALGI